MNTVLTICLIAALSLMLTGSHGHSVYLSGHPTDAERIPDLQKGVMNLLKHVEKHKATRKKPCDDFYNNVCGDFKIDDKRYKKWRSLNLSFKKAQFNKQLFDYPSGMHTGWLSKAQSFQTKCGDGVHFDERTIIEIAKVIEGWKMFETTSNAEMSFSELAGRVFLKTGKDTIFGAPYVHDYHGFEIAVTFERFEGQKRQYIKDGKAAELLQKVSKERRKILGLTNFEKNLEMISSLDGQLQDIVENGKGRRDRFNEIYFNKSHFHHFYNFVKHALYFDGKRKENTKIFVEGVNLDQLKNMSIILETEDQSVVRQLILLKMMQHLYDEVTRKSCFKQLRDFMPMAAIRVQMNAYHEPRARLDLLVITEILNTLCLRIRNMSTKIQRFPMLRSSFC